MSGIIPDSTLKKDLICAAAGLLIGGLGMYAWYSSQGNDYAPVFHELEWRQSVAEGDEMVPVVYCVRDIPKNTVLTRGDLVTRTDVSISHLWTDSIGDQRVAIGRTTLRPLKKGDYLPLSSLINQYMHFVFGDPIR